MTDIVGWGPLWLVIGLLIVGVLLYLAVQRSREAHDRAPDDAEWETFAREVREHQRRPPVDHRKTWNWPRWDDYRDRGGD